MVKVHDLSEDLIKDRFSWVFRSYVGKRRKFSVEELAELTGINSRTIESYRAGDTCPSLWNLLRICKVMPDSFTNELLAFADMTGAHNVDGEAMTAPELLDLLVREAAWFTDALKDGVFCHVERGELERRWPKFTAAVNRAQQHINGRVVERLHREAAE